MKFEIHEVEWFECLRKAALEYGCVADLLDAIAERENAPDALRMLEIAGLVQSFAVHDRKDEQ